VLPAGASNSRYLPPKRELWSVFMRQDFPMRFLRFMTSTKMRRGRLRQPELGMKASRFDKTFSNDYKMNIQASILRPDRVLAAVRLRQKFNVSFYESPSSTRCRRSTTPQSPRANREAS